MARRCAARFDPRVSTPLQAVEEFPECGALLQQRARQRLSELNLTTAKRTKSQAAGRASGGADDHGSDMHELYGGGGDGEGGAGKERGSSGYFASRSGGHGGKGAGGERASSGILQTAPVAARGATPQRRTAHWVDESFESQHPAWCGAAHLPTHHPRTIRSRHYCAGAHGPAPQTTHAWPLAGTTTP